jgi:hypothetical protein
MLMSAPLPGSVVSHVAHSLTLFQLHNLCLLLNRMMNMNEEMEKDEERSGHGKFYGTIPVLSWWD